MLGEKTPYIELLDQSGQIFKIDRSKTKYILLVFYPKDLTSGCTTQACAITEHWSALQAHDCYVIGISRDSPRRHQKFIETHHLPYTLLSDPDALLCEKFGVWVEKSMYGKRYMGIERSSFLLDSERQVCCVWRKVKPAEHISLVLSALESR